MVSPEVSVDEIRARIEALRVRRDELRARVGAIEDRADDMRGRDPWNDRAPLRVWMPFDVVWNGGQGSDAEFGVYLPGNGTGEVMCARHAIPYGGATAPTDHWLTITGPGPVSVQVDIMHDEWTIVRAMPADGEWKFLQAVVSADGSVQQYRRGVQIVGWMWPEEGGDPDELEPNERRHMYSQPRSGFGRDFDVNISSTCEVSGRTVWMRGRVATVNRFGAFQSIGKVRRLTHGRIPEL
jgi:hypothetical protein